MPTTLLHTADWQIGKPFAGVEDEQKRALLLQERLNVLERIKEVARAQKAEFLLIAGDLFDSPSVTKYFVSAACSAIGQMGVPVLAIPGNHDHGGPGSIWEQEFFKEGFCKGFSLGREDDDLPSAILGVGGACGQTEPFQTVEGKGHALARNIDRFRQARRLSVLRMDIEVNRCASHTKGKT